MQWELLTAEDHVFALFSEWEALQRRAGRSLFTGPDWLQGWWRFIGKPAGSRLYIVTGRKEGRLVAVAPLAIRVNRGVRLLEWAAGSVCDYSDFLLEDPQDAEALWRYIRADKAYDLAHIKEVHPEAVCLFALAGFAKAVKQSDARSLRLQWPTLEDWLASLPYATRKQYRSRVKQAEAIGPLRYEVEHSGPVAENALQMLVAQKTALLKAQGRKGVFDAPGALDFFRAVSHAEGQKGALHFSTLYCADKPIALHLGFVFKGAFLSYMPSYDPAFSAVSPGRLMLFECVRWAIRNDVKIYDFMRGEDRYKNSFSNDAAVLKDFMFPRTFKGRIAAMVYARRKRVVPTE